MNDLIEIEINLKEVSKICQIIGDKKLQSQMIEKKNIKYFNNQ